MREHNTQPITSALSYPGYPHRVSCSDRSLKQIIRLLRSFLRQLITLIKTIEPRNMKGKVSKQIEGFDLECTHGSISVQFVSICCRKTLIYINLIAYAATTSFDPCVQCPTKHCTKFQSIICLGLEGWQSRMGYEFAKRAAIAIPGCSDVVLQKLVYSPVGSFQIDPGLKRRSICQTALTSSSKSWQSVTWRQLSMTVVFNCSNRKPSQWWPSPAIFAF